MNVLKIKDFAKVLIVILVVVGFFFILFNIQINTVMGQSSNNNDGDIICNCKGPPYQRYWTPGGCMRNCRGGGLRRSSCGCILSPRMKCNVLNDKVFKQMYMFHIFRGHITREGYPVDSSLLTVASTIINQFYQPFKSTDFHIVFESGERSFWAKIEEPTSRGAKPFLRIHRNLFLMSPAFLVQAIGHEMIHAIQMERGESKTQLHGIQKTTEAFLELEASYWEAGTIYLEYDWKIGPNELIECLSADEMKSVKNILECRKWQVRNWIEIFNDLRPGNLNRLEKWLKQNHWTRHVWLPNHPNWKKLKAGNQPEGCDQ